MAQQESRLRARCTLREGKQRHNTGVEDDVVRDGDHEAISSRWCTFLIITRALVHAPRRIFWIDRDALPEPYELIALIARRTLDKSRVAVVEKAGDAKESVRGGDAAQKGEIRNDFLVFRVLE
jgi:hypothetical protein